MTHQNPSPSELTRRQFVKSAAAACAVGSIAPTILHAQDKAGDKAMVLGEGKHTYELVPGWGKLPESKRYGNTHGVAVDSESNVYIFNQSDDALVVFDKDGKFIKSWGAQYKPGAHGLTLNKERSEEFLYLCDYARPQVVKTTLDGDVIQEYGMPPMNDVYPEPGKYKPTNLAVAPNGDVYVADGYGQSWVHQYKNDGEYVKSWGGKGKEQGKLSCPHGIWIDRRGTGDPVIIVADRANERLQTFAHDGTPVEVINGDFRHPCHFDTKDGDLLVPGLHGVVSILDSDNKVIARLGDNPGVNKQPKYPNLPHEQRVAGKFISPHGACWDHNGDLYVVEWVADGRVTKLRRVG